MDNNLRVNKYKAFISTGKLEILVRDHEQLLAEVKSIQKHLEENDYINFAITFGKLSELAKKHNIDIAEELDFLSNCVVPFAVKGEEERELTEKEKVLNKDIEDVDFSVRTFNCLKRSGVNKINDIYLMNDQKLHSISNLGGRIFDEIVKKMYNLGLTDFPRTD